MIILSSRIFILAFLIIMITVAPAFCNNSSGDQEILLKPSLKDGDYSLEITADGIMSLFANNAHLKAILNDVASRTGINIQINSRVKSVITTSINNIPVEDALRKLTDNSSMIFIKDNKNSYKISDVIVLPSSLMPDIYQKNPPGLPSGDTLKKSGPKPSGVSISTVKPNTTGNVKPFKQKSGVKSRFVPNEIVVSFKENIQTEDIQTLINKQGMEIKQHIRPLNYYVLSLHEDITVEMALTRLKDQKLIHHAEPNYIIPIKTVPDDPYYSTQWGLANTGQSEGNEDADMDAEEAWDIEKGDGSIIIAIIDTGVDYNHEDLSANIWQNQGEIAENGIDDDGNGYIDDIIGWDFVNASSGYTGEDIDTPDNDPMDRHGHGTHTAGIAGAVANNGLGVTGVAWNCSIMPVRAGYKDLDGSGVLESADAAQAIVYAAENGAKVINLSWGDYQNSVLIEDAIDFAAEKGILLCAAAGNDENNNPVYPAASENPAIIAVGGTDNRDQKASTSNWGNWVHVSAPGEDIYSTTLNNSYKYMSGSSMATPHVSGLAALLFSYSPGISPLEVKTRIMNSVDKIDELNGYNITSGRINAYSALTIQDIAPYIFSINTTSTHEGDLVTIIGSQFGDEQADGYVKFLPGQNAEIITWSNSTIVCRVPAGAQSGEVVVYTPTGASNGIELIILTRYYDEELVDNEFLNSGDAKGWEGDDEIWLYNMPFNFRFFGKEYSSVYVSSNGFLDFTSSTSSYLNSVERIRERIMIAPFWADLIIDTSSDPEEDIYIHTPSSDSICFRWKGELHDTGEIANFEAILYKDGRIRFNYGPGNNNIYPVIGISGGDTDNYHMSTLNNNKNLESAQSVLFTPHEQSFSITLKQGWNLISFPIEPNGDNIADIIGDAQDKIESIWGYEGGEWQVHIPGNTVISNLNTLASGLGYWIKLNYEEADIQIPGSLNLDATELEEGWNLVGFRATKSLSIPEAIEPIEDKIISVWAYFDGNWKVYIPGNSIISSLTTMSPGIGYWINTSEACTWTQ